MTRIDTAERRARYEDDVYSWSQEQAAALRRAATSRVNLPTPIDFLNVAEEIESLGISQLRELYSRYRVLLAHLLKWQHQPEQRSGSRRATIRLQRDEIAKLLRASPGLKPRRAAELAEAWAPARLDAADEAGLAESVLPKECPWTLEQIEDASFWP